MQWQREQRRPLCEMETLHVALTEQDQVPAGTARFDVFDIYAANFDGSDLIPSTMSSAFIGHNLDARFFVFFVLFFGVLGCSGPRDVSTNIFVTFYGEKTVQQFWCLIHN